MTYIAPKTNLYYYSYKTPSHPAVDDRPASLEQYS